MVQRNNSAELSRTTIPCSCCVRFARYNNEGGVYEGWSGETQPLQLTVCTRTIILFLSLSLSLCHVLRRSVLTRQAVNSIIQGSGDIISLFRDSSFKGPYSETLCPHAITIFKASDMTGGLFKSVSMTI